MNYQKAVDIAKLLADPTQRLLSKRGSAVVDARTNTLDPRADILRRISEQSKRLVWLNPEGRMAWGWGDSEMPRYAAFCSVVSTEGMVMVSVFTG